MRTNDSKVKDVDFCVYTHIYRTWKPSQAAKVNQGNGLQVDTKKKKQKKKQLSQKIRGASQLQPN